ncbi:MAG: PAS domain-containing protein [Desulfobacterales bacterium]|nr:PAS domain-containing protein [Desulfobacterales bacterium]
MSNTGNISPELPGNTSGAVDLDLTRVLDLLPCYLTIQDRNLNILYANRAFREDLGDGVGKLCHAVYKRSSAECNDCPVRKTFHDKMVHMSEEIVQLANGKIRHILVRSSPIFDEDGALNAVIEMSTNITHIKKVNKELTALGQSMAMLSHTIKNILEGLQGGAYVVDEGIKDKDMPLARKGWRIVKKNIFYITDVVQNILFASKNRGLSYKKASPGELVKDAVDLFKERAGIMGVHLVQEVNPGLGRVKLDVLSIRRLLNNLIWNALEACEKDAGKETHTVSVKVDFHDEAHFMFVVSDDGGGMDPETRRRIFEEFYTTKGTGGTGLGLAVVDKIVNKHGGRIEVETAPGEGCLFRMIFKL